MFPSLLGLSAVAAHGGGGGTAEECYKPSRVSGHADPPPPNLRPKTYAHEKQQYFL